MKRRSMSDSLIGNELNCDCSCLDIHLSLITYKLLLIYYYYFSFHFFTLAAVCRAVSLRMVSETVIAALEAKTVTFGLEASRRSTPRSGLKDYMIGVR